MLAGAAIKAVTSALLAVTSSGLLVTDAAYASTDHLASVMLSPPFPGWVMVVNPLESNPHANEEALKELLGATASDYASATWMECRPLLCPSLRITLIRWQYNQDWRSLGGDLVCLNQNTATFRPSKTAVSGASLVGRCTAPGTGPNIVVFAHKGTTSVMLESFGESAAQVLSTSQLSDVLQRQLNELPLVTAGYEPIFPWGPIVIIGGAVVLLSVGGWRLTRRNRRG